MLFSAVLSFCIAFACLLLLVSPMGRRIALDRPNERSLHAAPVPRTGGLAITAGVAVSLAYLGRGDQGILLIALTLAAVSFCDDLFGLPTLLRLAVHLCSAGLVLIFILPETGTIVFPLALLAIAWITNLYNFMDGSDGLAGGMTVVGFGAYAIGAHAGGAVWLAVVCASIASSALAFLLFNFHPAKIFMGDAGSIPLGFLAGAVGVSGWQSGIWPVWFPLLVFSPFVVDATLTLLKRILRRERVWQAHRDHYYQRLVRMGFGHRNTALVEYLLMTACATLALAARDTTPFVEISLLTILCGGYAALALWIDFQWAQRLR